MRTAAQEPTEGCAHGGDAFQLAAWVTGELGDDLVGDGGDTAVSRECEAAAAGRPFSVSLGLDSAQHEVKQAIEAGDGRFVVGEGVDGFEGHEPVDGTSKGSGSMKKGTVVEVECAQDLAEEVDDGLVEGDEVVLGI